MKSVKLCDASFETYSFGFGGVNILGHPIHFEWDRTPGTAKVKVFTDGKLDEAIRDKSERKVALLIEPRATRPAIYDPLFHEPFDAVLTFDQKLCDRGMPYLFYPLGGSWVNKWHLPEKTKDVSILLSSKTGQQGHKLRHEVAGWNGIDAYGAGVQRWIDDKSDALKDYRYSVVIENSRQSWYFSEKLIDCISQGTIPLYWGCPGIRKFFDMRGIITWGTLDLLRYELKKIGPDDYHKRLPGIKENLRIGLEYVCPEDYIWAKYPGLLT